MILSQADLDRLESIEEKAWDLRESASVPADANEIIDILDDIDWMMEKITELVDD